MKTVLVLILACLGLSNATFAQENTSVTSKSKTEVAQSKESGIYSFTMPEGTTKESIDENSKYYTRYFSVNFDASTRIVKLTLVTNDDKNRHVIVRFLTACGIQTVVMDGKEYQLEDFFVNFMQ